VEELDEDDLYLLKKVSKALWDRAVDRVREEQRPPYGVVPDAHDVRAVFHEVCGDLVTRLEKLLDNDFSTVDELQAVQSDLRDLRDRTGTGPWNETT